MMLHRDDVEAVASRVVELLREERLVAPAAPELIDAAEVARRFGVTPTWARRNADRLGAVRLGDGSRPRLRYDPERVAAALSARPESVDSKAAPIGSPAGIPPRRRRRRSTPSGGLVPGRNLESAAIPQTTGPRRANARPPATGGTS